MISFIKNLFKPKKTFIKVKKEYKKVPKPNVKEPKINWITKVDEDVISNDFFETITKTILSPGQYHIPALWERHIRLCLEHKRINNACWAIQQFKHYIPGTNINLQPLENMIYNSKEYKEYLINNKKIEIESDFK